MGEYTAKVTKYLLALVLVLLVGYGALEAWPLVAGPSLTIAAPVEGASVPGGILNVAGRALRVTSLSLDGAPLLPDQQGNFSTTLTFPAGGTILTFVAADRFGRSLTLTREIFVPTANTSTISTTTNP